MKNVTSKNCSIINTIFYCWSQQEAFEKCWAIRHCEQPHALILHCHSPGVATVARRLRIDVHDNDDNNNDNA